MIKHAVNIAANNGREIELSGDMRRGSVRDAGIVISKFSLPCSHQEILRRMGVNVEMKYESMPTCAPCNQSSEPLTDGSGIFISFDPVKEKEWRGCNCKDGN